MARTVFELVSPAHAFETFPIRLEQSAARGSAVSRLLLVMPAVMAFSVPLIAIVAHVTAQPDVLDLVVARPLASAQILVGLALWVGLFVLPARRALVGIWARREVEIADGLVHVEDRSLFGVRRWTVALSTYRGLAHHIRASLSGLTHEIVLVHGDPSRTVTLLTADRISQATLDGAKLLLGLPELPARAIYEREIVAHRDAGAALKTARA